MSRAAFHAIERTPTSTARRDPSCDPNARAAARALAMFYVALGAFAVMVAGLAFATGIEKIPEPPGPRWACADDEYVVISSGECLHVDGLVTEPPTTTP